jgi:hypothetical protein
MKYQLFILALFCAMASFGQSKEFKISGTLFSADENLPLEAATVHVETIQDSTLVTYSITERDGSFVLEDKTGYNELNLFVSYVGYQTLKKKISLTNPEVNLGKINLEVSNALNEVVIKTAAPVTIKKDTLEFNVKSFKTQKDATVEDLLKKLPGVEIDSEGKIKINGKDVNKILVNGKPFFGNDPTITTKNLTKEIIEKVQIVDTKTKSEAYAGEDGDTQNKTINLTIKEENNKGVFGRVAAGAGTDKRWEFAGLFNRFDNDQRISVLAGGNNINSPGFSFGEISKMFGRGSSSFSSNGTFTIDGRSFGGGQGITTSKNAGANYADKVGEKGDISGDYFYSNSNSVDATSSQRQTFLTNGTFFSNTDSNSNNDTQSHVANLDYEVKIDTTLFLNVRPSFSYSTSQTTYASNQSSLNANRTLTNQSTVNSFVDNESKSFKNRMELTKKIGAKGAYVKAEINNDISTFNGEDTLNSNTLFFGSSPDVVRDQFTEEDRESNNYETKLSGSIPLVKDKWYFNLEYGFQKNEDENVKSTFDRNLNNAFNPDLSTDFEYTDTRNSPGASIRFKSEKFNTTLGVNYVFRTLENVDNLRLTAINRDFEAVEIDYYFNYNLSKKANIYFNYGLDNNPPSLTQLQPFNDVSNPLNTIVGNPNLEPTNSHRMYLGYNAYDWKERSGFYTYSGITLTENNIVPRTIVDPITLKRTTTYDNVNGNYNGYAGGSYSKTIKIDSLQSIRFRGGLYGNFNKNVNFNNNIQYSSKNISYSPNIGFEYSYLKLFEIKSRYTLSLTNNTYDIEAFEDINFTVHRLEIETATFFPKKFEWRNDVNYTYNTNIADGFQKSAVFWNSSLSYAVLKDKGLVTLKVYDLLNQNTNATRRASQDYIEDRQSTVLTQYFMLNFSWKFNSLGSKGESRGGNPYYFN